MGNEEIKQMSLEDLAKVVNEEAANIKIVLHKAARWMDWESTIFLTGEAQVVGVDMNEDWPLQISFTGKKEDSQPVPFDKDMEFCCRS